MKTTAIALSVILILCGTRSEAADCKTSMNALGPTAMQMPFDEFDQGENGWRLLSKEACFAEAALLIERYSYSYDSKYRLLKWHLAQMHAMAGDIASALAAAQLSLNPAQDRTHPEFDWNSYAKATIAFLQNDRTSFDTHRANLKGHTAKYPVNAPNDQALDRLSKCFGKPYGEAYACNAP